jgi:hypothetical protein
MLSLLADVVLVVLKCLDVLPWSWWIIIALPFAVAIGGTIAFAIVYLIIKIFVSMII